jgi:DNA-directed RNA polymerase sigma subunit (sigma70/sigma32)
VSRIQYGTSIRYETMPPTPKPPGQRRRRNIGQSQWKELPPEGRKGAAPPLPEDEEWLDSTFGWWKRIWASPMATIWVDADIEPLTRLARLKDDFDRGDRNGLTAIQNLEDRFGLSPKSRRQLQWEIKQGEAQQARRPSGRRHLRAVESA